MLPSHRFIFGQRQHDLKPRIERQCRAINGCRFANSPRFDRISPRIPVNNPAITRHARIGVVDRRGADVLLIAITCRALAHCAVQFPNLLTMVPVNPHL
ncbi:hypothetical protein [Burkholderia sp. BCC1993]|uniref:hypothetical protein n=1 Tax=Burkholderia sp. BCC1993 TaxID=2817444 RepID=UPI002AB00AB3|nr:hypothetical protein [Burkholderia sp. BCC1993]